MGDDVAALGSNAHTPVNQIEHFLDRMFTKINRDPPLVVLTAPFGGSTSPYKSITGEMAPGNVTGTNLSLIHI